MALPNKEFEAAAFFIGKKFDLPKESVIIISVVSPKEINRLNNEHRRIDKTTDVISFSYLGGLIKDGSSEQEIGDVIICHDVAVKQSEQKKHSLDFELLFLFVHGALHVLGYSDETEDEAQKMDILTKEILADFRHLFKIVN